MVMAVSENTLFSGSSHLKLFSAGVLQSWSKWDQGLNLLWSVPPIVTHLAISQFIGRVPDVTAPTARYPYEVTLHQGEIESLFLDSMKREGLQVERSIVPTSLQISEDPKELADPHAYPVKVCPSPTCPLSFKWTYFHTPTGRAKAFRQGIRR